MLETTQASTSVTFDGGTISERLARAICTMTFDALPEDVVEEAKLRLLDFLAVTIPAWDREASARIAAEFASRSGGRPEATIITVGNRVPAELAALANGVAAHSLELDDDHNTMVGHPGAPVIPAVLACAERTRSSGKTLLLGVIIAYDVVVRTAMAVRAGVLHAKGFHPTGTNGVFGATAGAAKVLGLSESETTHALGISASQSSGLIQSMDEGGWTKRLNAGWAAHAGVVAATLAQLGFTGPRKPFEGPHGWYAAYADAGTYDLDTILKDWGRRFEITRTSWKPYACNRYLHGQIDCALAIRRKLGRAPIPSEVDGIEVSTFDAAIPLTAEPRDSKSKPRTVVDAQFSSYFAVAVAVLKGRALLDEFSEETLTDRDVLDLAGKVTVRTDPELTALFPQLYPARVALRLKSGEIFEFRVRTAKGDPEDDLTTDELHERFTTLAGRVFDQQRTNEIMRMVHSLDEVEDVTDLTALCVR